MTGANSPSSDYARILLEWSELRPFGGFDLLMFDPAWTFQHRSAKGETAKSAQGQYACTPLDWIKGLPVDALAGPNSLCWLWATNPMLPQAIDTLAAWGFQFKTAGHWAKWNAKTRKQGFGTGYIFRCAGEPYVIGTRGKPRTTKSVRSVIMGRAREHSRKPEEAFIAAEKLMPDAKRIEVFSRQTRPGWSSWGDEAGKFNEALH